MRVLHFYRTYLPETVAGITNVIYQLCEGMRPFGVESEVLTLSPNPSKESFMLDNHRVHQSKSLFEIASTNFSIDVFGHFSRLAKDFDVIHYHYPWPFMDLVYLSKGRDKRSIVTYHSDIVKQKHLLKLYGGLMGAFLGNVDRIVATSPNYLASSEILEQYKDKTCIIPYGIDQESYPATDENLVAKYQQLFGDNFFLFVGVLRYYKGLEFLVEAAKQVQAPIVIAGTGPCEAQLKEQCIANGLGNVHFLGHVSDEEKIALLKASRAFVFPSHLRSEAFGISLLEASMMGKAMITCEIGSGICYVNKRNETGLSVPPENPDALANAVNELSIDKDKAERLGQNAKARFDSHFQANQMCAAYYKQYQEIACLNSGELSKSVSE